MEAKDHWEAENVSSIFTCYLCLTHSLSLVASSLNLIYTHTWWPLAPGFWSWVMFPFQHSPWICVWPTLTPLRLIYKYVLLDSFYPFIHPIPHTSLQVYGQMACEQLPPELFVSNGKDHCTEWLSFPVNKYNSHPRKKATSLEESSKYVTS